MAKPQNNPAAEQIKNGLGLYVRLYPDTALRTVCAPVDRFDMHLEDVLGQMFALMRACGGIGLAGPQVGIPQRLFVAEIDRQALHLVNPAILTREGRGRMVEGCLSLPGIQAHVERDLEILVQGYNAQGQPCTHHARGLWARVIQHEIDHLDGKLICDYRHEEKQA